MAMIVLDILRSDDGFSSRESIIVHQSLSDNDVDDGYDNRANIILTRRHADNLRLQSLLANTERIPVQYIVNRPVCEEDPVVRPEAVGALRTFITRKLQTFTDCDRDDRERLHGQGEVNIIPQSCDSIFVLSPEAGRILNSVLFSLVPFNAFSDFLKYLSIGAIGKETALQITQRLPQKPSHSQETGHDTSSTTLQTIFLPSVATKSNLTQSFPFRTNIPNEIFHTLLLGPSTATCPSPIKSSNRHFCLLELYDVLPVSTPQFSSFSPSSDEIIVFASPIAVHNWISLNLQQSNITAPRRIAVCIGPTTASAICNTVLKKSDSTNYINLIIYPQEPSLGNLAVAIGWAWRFSSQRWSNS